jgi:hypothetical protein
MTASRRLYAYATVRFAFVPGIGAERAPESCPSTVKGDPFTTFMLTVGL